MKKYYTLEGISKIYEDYNSADSEGKKVLKGVKRYAHGFHSKEEAEALRSGQWKKYVKENIGRWEIEADAIVYADGSLDEKTKDGSYGLIIFFKNGEVFYESALLKDIEPEKYKVIRYAADGSSKELFREYEDIHNSRNPEDKEHGYIAASNQIGGECDGVRHALEICCENQLKKIVVFYDCDTGVKVYEGGRESAKSNVTYSFAKLGEEMRAQGVDVKWEHVYSHAGKGNKKDVEQYPVCGIRYLHAVYNDLVDAMAKAEIVGKPIGISENFNLSRALLPDGVLSFNDAGAKTIEERRALARKYLEVILSNEALRPVFKA